MNYYHWHLDLALTNLCYLIFYQYHRWRLITKMYHLGEVIIKYQVAHHFQASSLMYLLEMCYLIVINLNGPFGISHLLLAECYFNLIYNHEQLKVQYLHFLLKYLMMISLSKTLQMEGPLAIHKIKNCSATTYQISLLLEEQSYLEKPGFQIINLFLKSIKHFLDWECTAEYTFPWEKYHY